MRLSFRAVAAAVAFVGAAALAPSVSAQTTPTTTAPASAKATVNVAETVLGPVLVDDKGMTLYMFTIDRPARPSSLCYGQCATLWPPLTVKGLPTAGPGVRASLLGRSIREDGTLIVTYAGWPLYGWAADAKPGDILGQGVGGVWWMIKAEGGLITTARPR